MMIRRRSLIRQQQQQQQQQQQSQCNDEIDGLSGTISNLLSSSSSTCTSDNTNNNNNNNKQLRKVMIQKQQQQRYNNYISSKLVLLLFLLYSIISLSFINIDHPFSFPLMIPTVSAYPVLIQIDETTERCIRFNIPDGDDAHLAAIVLPSIESYDNLENKDNEITINGEIIEDWYVSQVYDICYPTKESENDHETILKRHLPGINNMPDIVATTKSVYLQSIHGNTNTNLKIKITGTPVSDPKTFQHVYTTKLYDPIIVNHLGRTTLARAVKKLPKMKTGIDRDLHRNGGNANDNDNDNTHLEGYGICFHNTDANQQIQIVFAIVLASEMHKSKNSKNNNNSFNKERHLTPLEISLEQSIHNAKTIVHEMNYLEKRENRMRLTADSINTRIRWFSYVSVSVLLSVTYIQVTYLKRYFHKKKLM